MVQELLLVVLFAAALFYIGKTIYKAFQAKAGCSTGCAKCGAVDFEKIEQQLKEKGL